MSTVGAKVEQKGFLAYEFRDLAVDPDGAVFLAGSDLDVTKPQVLKWVGGDSAEWSRVLSANSTVAGTVATASTGDIFVAGGP